jgi:hypothetical protein
MLNPASARNLTNEELINILDVRRKYSFVIDELCNRLEKIKNTEEFNHKVECPVCHAALMTDIDDKNKLFTIRLDRHV